MSSCWKLSKGWERNGVEFRVPLAVGLVRGCFLCSLRYGGLSHEHCSPAAQCGNRIEHLKRKRLRASQSSTLMSTESVQPPSAFPLASTSSSTPLSAPPPSTRVMMAEMSSSASHSLVPTEGVGYPASMDGAHCTPQDASFPNASRISGPFDSDQTPPGPVAEPTQTGFWSQPPSQQIWAPTPPTQFVQSVAPPLIQDGSNLRPPSVNSHDNNILSFSGVSGPLNAVSTVSTVTGAAFTMTCPIPYCYFQCQTILDMWRHVTWTHEPKVESVVERVTLGGIS